MTSNEEKIKAFLSDEKKMKALLNDEEFINKVSSEAATAETYKEEFKKFDIELSDDEANRIKDTIIKIFKTPVEELNDEFLRDISGGFTKGAANNYTCDDRNIKNKFMTPSASSGGSSSGGSVGKAVGIGAAIVGFAWAGSALGCLIAGAVCKKISNKKFYNRKFYNDDDWIKYDEAGDKLYNIATRIATGGVLGHDDD